MKKYGKTDIEEKYERIAECRQIVKTIFDFGINQDQLIQIIHLLSLNLENTTHMKELASLSNKFKKEQLGLDTDEEEEHDEPSVQESKLILD